jgi:hypothetical protein
MTEDEKRASTLSPAVHAFAYPVFYLQLPLEDLAAAAGPVFSVDRFNLRADRSFAKLLDARFYFYRPIWNDRFQNRRDGPANCRQKTTSHGFNFRQLRHGLRLSRFVNGRRLDHSLLIDRKLAVCEFPKETTCVSLVARGPQLIHSQQNAIRIAIDSKLDHFLAMSALLPFSPQSISRAAEIGSKTGRDGFRISLLAHPCKHQHLIRRCVLSNHRQEPVDSF